MSNESNSNALAIHTIRACLFEGGLEFAATRGGGGIAAGFKSINAAQAEWLTMLEAVQPGYLDILGSRMKVKASDSHVELNDLLREEGFSIKLDPFKDPSQFGAVGIMHVGVKWLIEGASSKMGYYNETTGEVDYYDSAIFHKGISYYAAPGHPYPIAEISTTSTDRLFVTVAEKPLRGLTMLREVLSLQANMVKSNAFYLGLELPKITLDDSSELNSLLGMQIPRDGLKPYELQQLKLQVKFKLNHKGAQTDAAAAGGFGIESGPTYLEMNRPFLLWKTVEGLDYPVLAAYLDLDSWVDPGEFEINNG